MHDLIERTDPPIQQILGTLVRAIEATAASDPVWPGLARGLGRLPGVRLAVCLQRPGPDEAPALVACHPVAQELDDAVIDGLAPPDDSAQSPAGSPIAGPRPIRPPAAVRDALPGPAPLVFHIPCEALGETATTLAVWFEATAATSRPEIIDAITAAARAASWRAANLTLKAEVERLQGELEKDHLTGVKNRAFALELLVREIALARRRRSPLALIMLDIDNFKRFNDTYGHLTGDRVLCMVAKVLDRTARCGDITSRYGGEEFLVVLPDTTLENAQLFAERLRGAIERYGRRLRGLFPDLRLTISLGVTSVSVLTDSLEDAIARADRALYASKANGRNQVNVGPAPHQLVDDQSEER